MYRAGGGPDHFPEGTAGHPEKERREEEAGSDRCQGGYLQVREAQGPPHGRIPQGRGQGRGSLH